MPTQQTTYNSRVTDEALEKKFRDTFKSQGGAELVDDLYASGVIVPVVDFTAAAQGSELRSDLQVAWDFATGQHSSQTGTTTIITTPGFWKIDVNVNGFFPTTSAQSVSLVINDGASTVPVYKIESLNSSGNELSAVTDDKFVIWLRSSDSLQVVHTAVGYFKINVAYRQIADVSGNLVNPLGFTSS
jgi:hypothetical protein